MLGDKTVKKNHRVFMIKEFPAEENDMFLSTSMTAMMSAANQQLNQI